MGVKIIPTAFDDEAILKNSSVEKVVNRTLENDGERTSDEAWNNAVERFRKLNAGWGLEDKGQ